MKILLVEDEEMLNGITAKYLRAENMTVDTCFNGQQAIDYVNTSSYDVIVMDIMMPILDGISALAQMRNDGNTTPVLLLTAKDSLQDKVTGLNTGADDYLVKPFDLEELTARIYALARRNARHAQNDIHVGPLTINVPQRTVKRDGETITLTAKEFDQMCIRDSGKMYYDLQMVRINGSLVGAVLGGIFYGLYLLIEGVLK